MRRKYNPVAVGIIIAIVVFLYMIGPIDVLPDFIGGFGQIDDGLVLLLGLVAELVNFCFGMNMIPAEEKAETYRKPNEENGFGEYREL